MAKAKDEFRRAAVGGRERRRRSGSEKRRRGKLRAIRFAPEEDQRIAEMEETTGVPFSALVRHALFKTPPPRASRRPSVEIQAVGKVLAELGKIGSNINQLAHYANAGRPLNRMSNSLELALRDLAELRLVCLQVLGYESHRERDPEP